MSDPSYIVMYCGMSTDTRGVNDMTDTPENPDDDDGARTGTCLDGPLAGQELSTRYPKGALLCDRPAGKVWIYEWTGEAFQSRTGDDALDLIEDESAANNRFRAAAEGDYDVLAAPWAGGDPDEVDAYAGDDQADDAEEG